MLYITRRLFLKPFLKSYTASQCQMSTNKDKHFLELVNVKSRSGDIDFQQLKKKCLLIYFSAGWCGSCKALTPKLKKFYEQTKQGLEVVWVSKDKSEEDQLEHYENLPGWLYIQGKEIKDFYHIYNIQTIPALKLVDSEGEVITEDARLKVESFARNEINSRQVLQEWKELLKLNGVE